MKENWIKIKDFTAEQEKALETIMSNPDRDYLISGCAGSGKTILGLVLYKDINEDDGKSAAFVVFTKLLNKFTNDYSKGFTAANNMIYYHKWVRGQGMRPFDTMIIDESQDFEPDWIDNVNQSSRRRIWLGDSKQQIYDRPTQTTFDKITSSLDQSRQIYLKTNKRNTLYVALLSACFLPINDRKYFVENVLRNKDELSGPSGNKFPVYFIKANNIKDEFDAIAAQIKQIQSKTTPKTHIAITQHRHKGLDFVEQELKARGVEYIRVNTRDDDKPLPDFKKSKLVVLTTMHSIKGLEFDYVFFPQTNDPDNYINNNTEDNIKDNILHVLFTRATSTVYCSYTRTDSSNYLYHKVMGQGLVLDSKETIPPKDFVVELTSVELIGQKPSTKEIAAEVASVDIDRVQGKIQRILGDMRNL